MFKKILFIILINSNLVAYAIGNRSGESSGYSQAVRANSEANGDNQATSYDPNKTSAATEKNSPTVNSMMYSGAQFPEQNQIKGSNGQKYHDPKSQDLNNPTVNSMMYSGSQFPQQNDLAGQKKQKYYSPEERKIKSNNPTVNSRLYSGAQFNQENSFNNSGKTYRKNSSSSQ